jgi:DNA-binding LacI/PurR family transcriptional regulator
MLKKRATNIQHVAQHAGCSQVSVARVFSGGVKVSEKLKQRVLKAAEETGYSPNLLARSLRGGKSNTIALVCSLVGAHNPSEVPRKISKLFWDNEGKSSFFGMTSVDTLPLLLNDYLQRSVEGLVLEWQLPKHRTIPSEFIEQFQAAVIISAEKQDVKADQIIWDRGKAVCEAVDYLMKSGRKHPAIICDHGSNRTKLMAFMKKLEEYGLDPTEHHIFSESAITLRSAQDCYEILSLKFPSGKIPFDALVCANDQLALAANCWLKENAYRIPEDVAVVGFDNTQMGKFISPPLASVERKHSLVGKAAYELLSSRLKNKDLPPRDVYIAMEFVWRESAGKKIIFNENNTKNKEY